SVLDRHFDFGDRRARFDVVANQTEREDVLAVRGEELSGRQLDQDHHLSPLPIGCSPAPMVGARGPGCRIPARCAVAAAKARTIPPRGSWRARKYAAPSACATGGPLRRWKSGADMSRRRFLAGLVLEPPH